MKPVNSRVETPLGEGVVQGMFTLRQVEAAVRGVLVRIPLTDDLRKRLNDSVCLTPRATTSALFVFAEEAVR